MTMNRLMAGVAIALSLSTASGLALAQTKKELVAKLLQLQQPGIEGVGNLLANNTANQVMQAVGRQFGRVPADKREALAKDVQAEVKKFYDDVTPQLRTAAVKLAPSVVGQAYEEKLSEDELKAVIAWLESPVSKKYQQASLESQQAFMQKLVAETKTQVEPKLKSLEKTLGAKIDAVAGAPAASGAAPAAKK